MPGRYDENGHITDFYEEKNHIHAILRHNYDDYGIRHFGLEGKVYPKDYPAQDWDSWTFLRTQEVHSREHKSTSNTYVNPSPASRARILRCIVALYNKEWNPRVNTYIHVNLSFDHFWVRGKG